jgi:hypothetical protein
LSIGRLFNGILANWAAGNITAVQEGQVRSQLMVQAFLSVSADGVNAQKVSNIHFLLVPVDE